jgi:hypothetical protein
MSSIQNFDLRPPLRLMAPAFKAYHEEQLFNSAFNDLNFLEKLHDDNLGFLQKYFVLNQAKIFLRHVVQWHIEKTADIQIDTENHSISVEFKKAILESFNKQKANKDLVKAVEDINAVIKTEFQLGEFELKQKDGMNYRLDFKASLDFNNEQGLRKIRTVLPFVEALMRESMKVDGTKYESAQKACYHNSDDLVKLVFYDQFITKFIQVHPDFEPHPFNIYDSKRKMLMMPKFHDKEYRNTVEALIRSFTDRYNIDNDYRFGLMRKIPNSTNNLVPDYIRESWYQKLDFYLSHGNQKLEEYKKELFEKHPKFLIDLINKYLIIVDKDLLLQLAKRTIELS